MQRSIPKSSLFLLTVLAIGHFTVDMHSGSLPSLFPVLRETYGISYTQVGFLMLISQITSSVIQPFFGLVSDRISTRWLLPVSLAIASLGLLLIGSAQTYPVVMAGVVIMGIGIAAYHPEASKLVHFVGGERKGKAMSIFAIGGNIGIGFGPALMGAGLLLWGMSGTVLFLPVTLLAMFLVLRHLRRLYAHVERPAHATQNSASPSEHGKAVPWRSVILLLFIIFLRSGAHATLLAFVPMYYTDQLGNPGTYSSLLLTTFLLSGAFGTYLGGPVSDRFGPRTVIMASLWIVTPLIAVLSFTSGGYAPFLLMAAIGCSLISSFAVTTVLGQSLMANNVGLASGLTLGFGVGTGGITATALGWVADHWSLSTALLAISFLTLVGGLAAIRLPTKRKEPSMQSHKVSV